LREVSAVAAEYSMPSIRIWHAYLGMLLAPSVAFFALTGVVQIFSLHEAHGSYKPAAVVEKFSAVHKDQVFEANEHEPESSAADVKPQEEPLKPVAVYMLKWFFALVAVGLMVSTVLGVWMGLKGTLRRRTHLWLLLVGAALPLGLSVIQ
jgi:hypothetical protein